LARGNLRTAGAVRRSRRRFAAPGRRPAARREGRAARNAAAP